MNTSKNIKRVINLLKFMDKEIVEGETTQNPDEIINEDNSKLTELEGLNKQLYARTKKSEDKVRELEIKLNEVISKKSDPVIGYDTERLISDMTAMDGLDSAEKTKLIKDAKAYGVSLNEMRSGEDYALWLKSHQEKVVREKSVLPTTKQGESIPTTWKGRWESAKTQEEKSELLHEAGLIHERFLKKSN